jgi:hypothetical protein
MDSFSVFSHTSQQHSELASWRPTTILRHRKHWTVEGGIPTQSAQSVGTRCKVGVWTTILASIMSSYRQQ